MPAATEDRNDSKPSAEASPRSIGGRAPENHLEPLIIDYVDVSDDWPDIVKTMDRALTDYGEGPSGRMSRDCWDNTPTSHFLPGTAKQ